MGEICHTFRMELRRGLPELEELLELPPAIALSFVISLDGQLVGPDGSSRSLSADIDLELLRRLRASADVVVVGKRTAEVEQYSQIRVRPEFETVRRAAGMQSHPALVVVDRTGPALADIIAEHGPRVALEAGPRLALAYVEQISRVWLSHAPVVVGNHAATLAVPLPPLRDRWLADDYVVSRFEH